MQISKIAEKALAIVNETANFIRKSRLQLSAGDVSYKLDKSLVTTIDLQSEERLVTGLQKLIPESNFLAEEKHKENPLSHLTWIIDPIDGTTNFVHNYPNYCISVALWYNDRIVLGIVHEISTGEVFWSHSESGVAYLNKTALKVSTSRTLGESILATGFPSSAFDKIDIYLKHFRDFMQCTQGIRRLGSAAMDLAYVASGRCDGFFEYDLKPWDVAAGAYLVQKAGGMVTDFSGGNNYLLGGEMLASNNWIHREFLKHFSKDLI